MMDRTFCADRITLLFKGVGQKTNLQRCRVGLIHLQRSVRQTRKKNKIQLKIIFLPADKLF